MVRFIWRIRFAIALAWIYRDFKGWHLKLGWEVSGKTQFKDLPPHKAALEEVERWYS